MIWKNHIASHEPCRCLLPDLAQGLVHAFARQPRLSILGTNRIEDDRRLTVDHENAMSRMFSLRLFFGHVATDCRPVASTGSRLGRSLALPPNTQPSWNPFLPVRHSARRELESLTVSSREVIMSIVLGLCWLLPVRREKRPFFETVVTRFGHPKSAPATTRRSETSETSTRRTMNPKQVRTGIQLHKDGSSWCMNGSPRS